MLVKSKRWKAAASRDIYLILGDCVVGELLLSSLSRLFLHCEIKSSQRRAIGLFDFFTSFGKDWKRNEIYRNCLH